MLNILKGKFTKLHLENLGGKLLETKKSECLFITEF